METQNAAEAQPAGAEAYRFFPLYNELFGRWMTDPLICSKFLGAVEGRPVALKSAKAEVVEDEFAVGTRGGPRRRAGRGQKAGA